ncbi:GNAT family N-acetyltransferase, partial [candidate division KSB1 bacterium]
KIEMTLTPIFYAWKINHYLDFALFRNGFSYRKREVSSFVTLDFSADEVLQTFKNESRTAVRRAIKLGVAVRESEDFPTFYQILRRNLKMRHNVQPTHTLDELICLKNIYPERIHLYAAYLQEQMIAGVVMFHCNPLVTLAFYISHNEDFQQYRAVNLLFYEIFRLSIQQGFRYLDFGIFTVNMEPNWGLARFKENFGSKGIFRDTIVKVL